MRKKFDRYASLAKRINFLQVLNDIAEIVTIIESITACRDRKDDKFLEVAVNGKSDYLITGDRDLLVLHPFRNIPIVTPIEFISLHQIFRANGSTKTNWSCQQSLWSRSDEMSITLNSIQPTLHELKLGLKELYGDWSIIDVVLHR